MTRSAWWLLIVGVWCGVSTAAELEHFDVYKSGVDGYHTYRIPAIETTPDGTLLAFAEARKYNQADPGYGKQDIDLVLKRSTDGGRTWSAMTIVEDPGELWSAANPATIVDRQTGRVWVLYLRGKPERNTETARPGTDDVQTLARYSSDQGATWSEPIDITAVARDMSAADWRTSVVGPGGAIQHSSGRLVAAVWKHAPYQDFAIFSDDHGANWQRGELVPGGIPGDESQIVELPDGRLLMDIRQQSGPHRWMAVSEDRGQTWSEPRPGVTVTPVATAIERYETDSGDRILWSGPKGPGRANLVIRTSTDGGLTFPTERLLYEGPSAYSDLTVLPDKTVGVLWERGVKSGYEFITFTPVARQLVEAKP